jgi:hypothetical protein
LGVKLVRELEKLPDPVPSVVFVVNEIVGFGNVLQHTPRAVTADPPSEEIFPPLLAVVEVIDVIPFVDRVGTTGVAEGVTEFEAALAGPVPMAFVAVTVNV